MGRTLNPEIVNGWGGKTLVMCEGGPRAGAWYFLDDSPSSRLRPAPGSWLDLRRLAQHAGETPTAGRTLGYVRTDRTTTHRLNGSEAVVLVWSPHTAA
jgi:hypothetical protein